MQRKGSRQVPTWWPRSRQRKHRPRAHLLKARLRSRASLDGDGDVKARPERRPAPTCCQPSSSHGRARAAGGEAQGGSGSCVFTAGAGGHRELRSSLCAEEKTVGLNGEGGRAPGGGGGRRGAGDAAAIAPGLEDSDRREAQPGGGGEGGRATRAERRPRRARLKRLRLDRHRQEGARLRLHRQQQRRPAGGTERERSGESRSGRRRGRGGSPGEIRAAAARTRPSPPWSREAVKPAGPLVCINLVFLSIICTNHSMPMMCDCSVSRLLFAGWNKGEANNRFLKRPHVGVDPAFRSSRFSRDAS
nr:uncharacterized protein LOC127345094 isoform X1 [Lolium perenne]